jgi:hypothetical protein
VNLIAGWKLETKSMNCILSNFCLLNYVNRSWKARGH